MPLETFPYDSAERLDTPEAVAAYVQAAFETDDPAFITRAFGDVARARARARGDRQGRRPLPRESLPNPRRQR